MTKIPWIEVIKILSFVHEYINGNKIAILANSVIPRMCFNLISELEKQSVMLKRVWSKYYIGKTNFVSFT